MSEEKLKEILENLTKKLFDLALIDDPETNNLRTKLIAKRELIIELLANL